MSVFKLEAIPGKFKSGKNKKRVSDRTLRSMPIVKIPKPDWQIASICDGFVIEVNCNGGGQRRVYTDGHIELNGS